MSAIEYELKPEDMVAFADHHASHAPYMVRRTRRMRWIWGLLFAGLAIVVVEYSPMLAGVYGAFAIIFFAFYPRWTRWWYRRHNRRLYETAATPLFGRCQLTLERDQLRTRSDSGESLFNLNAIDRVESSREHLFVYVGPVQAIVIPKERVTSGDAEAITLELARAVPARRLTPMRPPPVKR